MVKEIRILFFIGSLRAGGKERRLIELLSYLKETGNYKMLVICTEDNVHYPNFFRLDIPYIVVRKQWRKYDPTVFYKIYKIAKDFKPDYIHTWGRIQTFYALPAAVLNKSPLINSQITAAPPRIKRMSINNIIDQINFKYSEIILANSKAGLNAYAPPAAKSVVIYNGLSPDRFINLPSSEEVRSKYNIRTPHAVIMVASVSKNKDYDLYYKVAQHITALRDDISFIGAGCYSENDPTYISIKKLTEENQRIIFLGKVDEVEALISACDIGVLLSNKSVHGEGISNAIMEYMALGKPVIANDAGGTGEIVADGVNGHLVDTNAAQHIAALITGLIDDPEKCASFGVRSREIIESRFLINKMGSRFEEIYRGVQGAEAKIQKNDPFVVES